MRSQKREGELLKEPGESSAGYEEYFSSNTSLENNEQGEQNSSQSSKPCRSTLRKMPYYAFENEFTRDFVASSSIVGFPLILAQLILRENGFSSEQLLTFVNFSWLWTFSLFLGYVAKLINLPPLLGMLAAGILISNVGDMDVTEEIRGVCTSAGLAIILLRSGLELDLKSIASMKRNVFLLTFIPGVVEALVCSVSAIFLFDMPFWLGLSLGFILAAVSVSSNPSFLKHHLTNYYLSE